MRSGCDCVETDGVGCETVDEGVDAQIEAGLWAGEGFAERRFIRTPLLFYSNPFAFRTVWAAGEERNVTSALAASV